MEFYQKICQDRNHFSLLSDIKLFTEDGWSFDAHRLNLANKSTFFCDLFSNNDRELTFRIPKFRGEILNEVLYFIYTDTVALNENNFLDMMMISDFLQIEELYNLSKEFTESILSTENCLKIFAASNRFNEKSLQKLSFRIILSNFETLRNEEDFAEMPVGCIQEILKDNSLRVTGENIVWDFVVNWAGNDPPNRFKEIHCLLKCLKLKDINESLANRIIQSDVISRNPFCGELQKMTLQKYESSLDTLKYIINFSSESSEIPFSEIDSRRLPDCVHVIVCPNVTYDPALDGSDYWGIYITYDKKLHIWRKLADFADQDYGLLYNVHIIKGNVYVFDFHKKDVKIFNLYTKEWREIENFFDGFCNEVSCSVVIESRIYLISNDSIRDRLKVKVYNTENGLISNAMPMYKMMDFKTASLLNKIFVVGMKLEHGAFNISAQIYDEESNSWSFMTAPSIRRSYFSLIAYHDDLYILGGVSSIDEEFVKIVEVFNIARNNWERIGDLPFSDDPEFHTVSVFNDKLFAIFGGGLDTKQFVLNEMTKTWVEPEELLPVKDSFSLTEIMAFHTIYDRQIMHILVQQSRYPETVLEKSPFQ